MALSKSELKPNILLISGAQEAKQFELPDRVDVLSLPAIHKLSSGAYTAKRLCLETGIFLSLRGNVILGAVKAFNPDLMIVDNAPRGVRGELDSSLRFLRDLNRPCVLGLRDILDTPMTVEHQWRFDRLTEATRRSYDEIWVYGDQSVYDMEVEYAGILPPQVPIRYVGYLDPGAWNASTESPATSTVSVPADKELVLCSVGGGQDGEQLARDFAAARLPDGMYGMLITGPYMANETVAEIQRQITERDDMCCHQFLPDASHWTARASRLICMGGYNTCMELLSFEVPALIVPRVAPRQEQILRAKLLAERGMTSYVTPNDLTADAISAWLAIAEPPKPRRAELKMDGLDAICARTEELLLSQRRNPTRAVGFDHA